MSCDGKHCCHVFTLQFGVWVEGCVGGSGGDACDCMQGAADIAILVVGIVILLVVHPFITSTHSHNPHTHTHTHTYQLLLCVWVCGDMWIWIDSCWLVIHTHNSKQSKNKKHDDSEIVVLEGVYRQLLTALHMRRHHNTRHWGFSFALRA